MQRIKQPANANNQHFVKRYFDAYQDGVLSERETETYRHHLSNCEECQTWVDTQQRIAQQLKSEASPSKRLSPAATARIQQHISSRMRRALIMNSIKSFVGATLAIAVLAVIVGFFVLQTRDLTTTETDEPVTPEIAAAAQGTPESDAAEQTTPESIPAAESADEQLFEAIIAKDTAAVKQALEAGANPNAVNSEGFSALRRAVRIAARVSGNTDIIDLLLEFGADVHGLESDGKPTLQEAVEGRSIEVAQVLLAAGADANGKMPLKPYSPVPFIQAPILMEPISLNDIEMVELLIEHGADVNQAEQRFQYTPLHYAAELNFPEIIKILLDNGADPTLTQRQYAETPLHTAVIGYTEAGSVEAIQAFLDGGVDVDIRASSMMTPIMYMLFKGHSSQMTEIVTMLLDGGADLTLQDVNGDTALHYAARHGRSEVISLLIEHGAVLDMVNNNGETALDVAKDEEIIELLAGASAPSAPAKITTVEELVGIWENNYVNENRKQSVYYFRADGIMEFAESLAALEAGEIKARVDYWFEDGEWRSQFVTGIWHDRAGCYSGTGQATINRYEIRPVDEGTIKFGKIIDSCTGRFYGLSQGITMTLLDMEDVDWFNDPETDLPLNPAEFPADSQFVLVGTLLNLDASAIDAPQVTIRIPSGQAIDVIGVPLTEIIITGEYPPDLTTYDPEYPMRSRLLVQLQEDGSLQAMEMHVLTTLE